MSKYDNDQNIISGCLAGNPQAWAAFVDKYSNVIYKIVFFTLKKYLSKFDQSQVEDLSQDVFLSLYENNFRKLRSFEGKNNCSLESWLKVVAVRQVIDYLRKNRRIASIDDEKIRQLDISDKGAETENIDEEIDKETQLATIKKAIAKLSSDEQKFVKTIFNDTQTPEEAARSLNISVDNFYMKKSRIIKRLKELMEGVR